ncbi:MAG TPA: DNRLRE domain-containing protein, partial [Planctomycetota bacterium]|nr:DNRLRE domain-containing protein [Planctomycetota bacterium]
MTNHRRACLTFAVAAAISSILCGFAAGETVLLRNGEDTWLDESAPHKNNGGDRLLCVGNTQGSALALLRFDLSEIRGRYNAITGAKLQMKLSKASGGFAGQAFDLYCVARTNRGWGAGSSTWASLSDGGIIHLDTGDPIRTPWAGGAGLAKDGTGKLAASATVSAADAGKTITWVFADFAFLDEWVKNPDAECGFVLKAAKLEAGQAALFHSFDAPSPADRPLLDVSMEGYRPPACAIPYTLAEPGKVSIVIINDKGLIVRELLHGAFRVAGQHAEAWDGLDERGSKLAPGTYAWKLLQTQGLKAEYVMTIGTSPSPGWERWPGNHNPVTNVAADETGCYFAAGSNEGPLMMVKQTLDDEKRLWESGHFGAFAGAYALASDGGKLFMVESSSKKVFRLNAVSGKKEATLDGVPAANQPLLHIDIAARGGKLLVSYFDKDVVRWFDADGKQLSEASVPGPLGVAIEKDGSGLVISKGKVLRLAAGKPAATVVAADKLTHPWRLDTAPNGDILVAESTGMFQWACRELKQPEPKAEAGRGNQVKRFARGGTLKAAYGNAGGRPKWGKYEPEKGFGDIIDIAALPDGGALITDMGAPARAVRIDAAGKVLREWFGGQTYGPWAGVNPADPTDVWLVYGWGYLVRYKADYAKKTWKVASVYTTAVPLFKFDANGALFIRRLGKDTYVCTNRCPAMLRLDEKNATMVPASTLSFPMGGGPAAPAEIEQKMKAQNQLVYQWADKNGNGKMDAEEFDFPGGVFRAGGAYVDEQFNYYMPMSDNLLKYGKIKSGMCILRPQGYTAAGVPMYDNRKQEYIDPIPDYYALGSFEDVGVWKDEDGSLFNCFNTNNEKKTGVGFWSPRAGGNRVAKWDKDGKFQWCVGRHSATGGAAPGEGRYFWRMIGIAHGCVVVGDMENSLQHVWDRDGLWVGRLLESPVRDGLPDHVFRLCGEAFGGAIHTEKSGDVLFFGSGENNVPVFRVTGWD